MADLWSYDPSWRDRVATGLLGLGMPRSSVVGLMGSAGLGEEGPLMGGGLLDMTPAGIPFWMNEAYRTAGTPEGTLRAMALIPGAKPLGEALGKGAARVAGRVAKPIRAYHGSPHDFDRFSMERIGTGEGAQAYGHGLYFAEREGVARSYRDELSSRYRYFVDDAPVEDFAPTGNTIDDQILGVMKERGVNADPLNAADTVYNRANGKLSWDDVRDALSRVKKRLSKREVDAGSMYEVNIHADPNDFLDWDKPLYQQPNNVQGVLQDMGVDVGKRQGWTVKETSPGKFTVYNVWGEKYGTFKDRGKAEAYAAQRTDNHYGGGGANAYHQLGGNAAYNELDKGDTARRLRDAGVPGIRYLDQGSRSAGEGSRNYVVFDDNLIEIIRKYGIAGLLGGGAAGYGLLGNQPTAQAAPGLMGARTGGGF